MCLHNVDEHSRTEPSSLSMLALKPLSSALPLETPELYVATGSSSRRRKLWELSHRQHCPVVGTCLSMDELRRLARRAGLDEKPISDYSLHAYAVGQVQERSEFSKIIQRELDRRFAPIIKRFAAQREAAGLLALWRDAMAAGEVAGALWAAITHPACDEVIDKAIYGEIHMLSHQVGGGHRADLKRLASIEIELATNIGQSKRDRERAARRQSELESHLRDRDAQLADFRRAASELDEVRRRLAAEVSDLQCSRGADAEWRRRAEAAERKLEAQRGERLGLQRRFDAAEAELHEMRIELASSEGTLTELAGFVRRQDGNSPPCGVLSDCEVCPGGPAAARLSGRCLLCIGGRENLVSHYRGLVEGLGGRFLHHDGGIEDNPKRLEATLASADAVVCQAGCVSHTAYWKLKEYCKRHNKPCVYLKRSGVTSFARGVELLVGSGDLAAAHLQ